MKKHIKLIFVLIVIVFLMFGVGAWSVYICLPHQWRVKETQIQLLQAKKMVWSFHRRLERYPQSFAEIIEFSKEHPEEIMMDVPVKEFITDPNGNSTMHSNLNDKGGWYYNPNTGEIRVNITQPVSNYFKWYHFVPYKNTIPAEW